MKMTQYDTFNVKLSNPQINKLKSGTKKGAEVPLNLPLNVAGDPDAGTNFPDKLLLTDTQVLKLCKVFCK